MLSKLFLSVEKINEIAIFCHSKGNFLRLKSGRADGKMITENNKDSPQKGYTSMSKD